jgi:thiamine biosynthesis lipoprotein
VQLTAASDELRSTYERALEWRARTDGLFTPNRPDGITDLNGIVKADAIAAAGAILETAGFRDWTINGGGDILVSGTQADGTAWSIGIVDPANRGALLCSIPVTSPRRAVATSGSVERGDHIWLGGSRERAELIQVTVLANDIVTADVLATAIVAGGPSSIDALVARFGVDVLTVDRQGAMLVTPGIRALITA